MSAFDYPRLMLTGTAICSPATGNNCRFVPLSIFEPVSGTSVIPPRIFLDGQLRIKEIFKECRKRGFKVKETTIDGKKHIYIEIAPTVLNDPQKFKDWALLQLGKYDGDAQYHKLYDMIALKFARGTLLGKKPGYFNYYGTTEFDFKDVKVHSIALHATTDGERILNEKNAPDDLVKLFQSELKINDGLISKAKMVDSASSVSMATQIFWDKLTLNKSSKVLFSSKPCKASLRFASASRIPGLQKTGGAHCASGTFFSTIRIEDIEDGHNAEILKLLFEKYKIRKNEELIGLQLVFNLFEVKEQVDPNEPVDTENSSVETTVIVAISPWYKGDLKSISMGRQLNAGINYLKKCNEKKPDPRIKEFFLSPVVAHVDYEQQYVMLDLINNIPEKCSNSVPIPGDDSRYQTMNIGRLICRLYESQRDLGTIKLNPKDFSRSHFLKTSGKVVLYNQNKFEPIDYLNAFRNERIAIYLYDSVEDKNLIGDTKDDYVMLESEYMIATDQGSLYASVHDDPAHGYRSFSGEKEHCKISMYKRGFECNETVPITIVQCKVEPWNLQIDLSNHRMLHYKNGDTVSFPTEKEFNGLYLFYANIDAPIVEELKKLYGNDWLWYYVNTYFNSYVGVRILPHQDYSKYLDLRTSWGREVTFEILKRDIFDRYDLLYPFMSRLFPFEEELFRKNQDHIYHLMSFDNWENSTYMPVSRDLSPQQLRLFLEWMKANKGAYNHSGDLNVPSTSDKEGFIPR